MKTLINFSAIIFLASSVFSCSEPTAVTPKEKLNDEQIQPHNQNGRPERDLIDMQQAAPALQ
ncbi:MAG TPA: hypothetical protein VGN64_05205 [Dyadobacter sp.]|jgi:hypothetical protein|nr:hypothetical protein [Dyadobacter sp.]